MATLTDRVRTAYGAGGRLALHAEVERMAAEGHTRQELEDALEALLLELRAVGADDDTEEEVNGVWDRLTGWCIRSGWIITRDQAPIIAEWEARQAAHLNGNPSAAGPAPARSPE